MLVCKSKHFRKHYVVPIFLQEYTTIGEHVDVLMAQPFTVQGDTT